MTRIDIIFDVAVDTPYHRPTVAAVRDAVKALGADVSVQVVTTDTIDDAYVANLPDGVVLGPGTPYRSPAGAEEVARAARERGLPLVGTWGGFQHVLVEHARTQVGIADAAHAEYGDGGTAVISLLACSINGSDITLAPTPGSRLAAAHNGAPSIIEHTTCNYGVNLDFASIASSGGMRVAAVDDLGEVRAVELVDHPFFMATLYQPQLRSTSEQPHPVFLGLVRAVTESHQDL